MKMIILKKTRACILFLCLVLADTSIFAQVNFEENMEVLRSRFDPNVAKSIFSNPNDLDKSAKELLRYFKKRTSVKYPKHYTSGHTDKDLKYANDALNHIFVGQRSYPSFFCGKDINWGLRPVEDKEWIWQLHRMYFWTSMAKVYASTEDEKYAKAWCEQMVDWVRKNPRDNMHKYAWRSIEAGIRGHSWTVCYNSFLKSEHFTSQVLIAFLNSCFEHAEYLMTRYKSGSNWALMEAEGLAFIAMLFPEFTNAEKWKTEAIRRFNSEISNQIYPDGHQRELAMGYHVGSINWFYRSFEFAKLNTQEKAFSSLYLERIEKMCEVPMKLCFPDGTNAQFGDSWSGSPGQYYSNFFQWAALFKRDDFRYFATEGAEGNAPEQKAFALKESGLYSMRSGWNKNATAMVLKCGPDGGNHCQQDNNTFSLYAGGRTLMPDAGSYIYNGDPEGRKWFKQTKVHQTLTLNGKNTKYAPQLLKWEPGEKHDILVVENDSYDDLSHRRSVFFVDKRYFIIVDEAIGKGLGDVEIHFQLAPGECISDTDDFSFRSNFKDGANVFVCSNKQKGLELIEEEGWVSFVYTKKEKRPAFSYKLKKTNAHQVIRFVTLVAPYTEEIPSVEVELLGSENNATNTLEVLIKENSSSFILKCEL
jgi:heparan-sulfate lyase